MDLEPAQGKKARLPALGRQEVGAARLLIDDTPEIAELLTFALRTVAMRFAQRATRMRSMSWLRSITPMRSCWTALRMT